MESMSLGISFRRLCCCCSCTKEKEEDNRQTGEEDYLLPGGEWDPSVSGISHRSTHGTKHAPKHSLWRRGSEEGASAYVPGAMSVPKFNHFKMLKTIGKGAFGKVCMNAVYTRACTLHLLLQSSVPCIPPSQVMLCVHTPTNILYAMKVIPKGKLRTQKQKNQIISELKILK